VRSIDFTKKTTRPDDSLQSLIKMKNFLPYAINHIDLSKQESLIPPATNNTGNYVVLWWNEVALGDFYIKPNEPFDEYEYRKRASSAILPVVQFYAGNSNFDFDWEHFFLTNAIKDWAVQMEPILPLEDVNEKPGSVPVSIIMCTRNRASFLHKCLNNLKEMTCLPQEIIVVDNAPSDNETKEIVKQFPEVTYVFEPRKGLDFARNAGLSKANCPIVAFTDDDVLVHPSWIYRVWKTFQTGSVAAMTGLVITLALDTEARLIFEKHWSFNMGYLNKTYDETYMHSSKAPEVWKIGAGANMAFRKSVFDEVGCFHELLGAGAAGCSDDSEMWFRILAKGKTIQYNPSAIVYHKHRKTIEQLNNQIFHYMRGFTAAALWQQRQKPETWYKYLIFFYYPFYYTTLAIKGFPLYHDRYKTIWVEIKGMISGLKFFYKKENRSSFAVREK